MQVWIDQRKHDEKIMLLDDANFIVDDKRGTDFDAARHSLEAGQPPEQVLSDKRKSIPLQDVSRVEIEPDLGLLTVHYLRKPAPAKGKKAETEKASDFWYCESPARCDEVVAAMKERLGEDFQLYKDAWTPLRAAFTPLMTLSVTWLLVFIFHDIAISMADGDSVDTSGRNSMLKSLVAWLLELLGPTGVMVTGYLVSAICIWKLYKRTMNPPVIHWLQATPHVPVKGWRLAVRYAILAVVSVIAVRAMLTG